MQSIESLRIKEEIVELAQSHKSNNMAPRTRAKLRRRNII